MVIVAQKYCRRGDGRYAGKAFTLVEIVVVVTIFGILMAVALPNFGPFRLKGQLRTAARELAAVMHYARAEAIYGHRAVELRLDVENAIYRLDLRIDSKPASQREGQELYDVEALRPLPEYVYFDRVLLYEGTDSQPKGIVVLHFTPRGDATPVTVVLSDVKGRHMTVDLFGTTGAVEVYKGDPDDYASSKEG